MNEELNYLYSSLNFCSDDKIEKNEMGEKCSAYGGEERRGEAYAVLWWGNLRERDRLGDPDLD
jgi:hypothetical protein